MKTKEVIGIDVSKLFIDVYIYSTSVVNRFKNSKTGFRLMLKWIEANTVHSKEETLYVFEHTGMYSYKLSIYLNTKEYMFYIASGLDIKRSQGIVRGKSDRIDAKRIALYGYRLREELKPCILASKTLVRLRNLLTLRTRIVKQRAGYKVCLKEQKKVYKIVDNPLLFSIQEKLIKVLSSQIKKIDKQLKELVTNNDELKKVYQLVISVKGIGSQTAFNLLVYTHCFSKFNNWRKFASYCGIAPFPYQSGISVKGKTKVSHLANKKLKSILSMCAISAIRHNTEMKMYYHKKVNEGKNKMSTINVIRNKLIARVFAVVKRQTPYVNTLKFAS